MLLHFVEKVLTWLILPDNVLIMLHRLRIAQQFLFHSFLFVLYTQYIFLHRYS
jgi:hypothetical protein